MPYCGFCLQKVYKCPCLTHIINQISSGDICRYDDIKKMVEDLHQGSGSGPIYSIQKTLILFPSTNAFARGA